MPRKGDKEKSSDSDYGEDFEDSEIEEEIHIPATPAAPKTFEESEIEEKIHIPAAPAAPTRAATSQSYERSKLIEPIEMPSSMVNICQKISSQYGGLVFAFFANSSLPHYEQPCIGKPHLVVIDKKSETTKEILGKSSNQGFAAGLLVEDSKRLGKMEANGVIREYEKPFDMPRDEKGNVPTGPDSQLGLIQHKQSLRAVFEGLQKKPDPDLKMVEEPGDDGILRVYDPRHPNPVIFSINLLDQNAEANMAKTTDEDLIASPEEVFSEPKWWKPTFGDFGAQIDFLYPASYETGIMHEREVQCIPGTKPLPLMVYGIKDEKGQVLPITSDQDLLWISIPRDLELPDFATKEIDTDRKEGPPQLLEDLHRLNDFFAKKNMPTLNLFPDKEKEMENILQAIAGFGIVTPYEAYMAILVNKELGLSIPHARRLIQHGTEAHSPPGLPAKEIGVVHHVGKDFAFQTNGEDALITALRTWKGYDRQQIHFSPKWKEKNAAWKDLKQGKEHDMSVSTDLHQAPESSSSSHRPTRG